MLLQWVLKQLFFQGCQTQTLGKSWNSFCRLYILLVALHKAPKTRSTDANPDRSPDAFHYLLIHLTTDKRDTAAILSVFWCQYPEIYQPTAISDWFHCKQQCLIKQVLPITDAYNVTKTKKTTTISSHLNRHVGSIFSKGDRRDRM